MAETKPENTNAVRQLTGKRVVKYLIIVCAVYGGLIIAKKVLAKV